MKLQRLRIPLLLLAALLPACATTDRIFDPAGKAIGVPALADALAGCDVVFLGELHENEFGHQLHHELFHLLHERRGDVVLSMEMFERDVQGVVDDYVAGRIDEAAFLAKARPWPYYQSDYRPLIEYARAHRLPVIAANLPRDLARKASREGHAALAGQPHVAVVSKIVKGDDPYYRRFREAMKDHTGAGAEAAIDRMYESQCLKDDTMAEAIVNYLERARGESRRPLVVHVNGKFHSDFGLGTAERVRWRQPDLVLKVVTMSERGAEEGEAGAGDYELLVRKAAPRPRPPTATRPAGTATHPATRPASHPTTQAETRPRPAAGAEEAPAARPGLGIMPDYENSVQGLAVGGVREDGPAGKAGIRAGDVLVKLAGQEVSDVQSYMQALGGLEVGAKVSVEVLRDGKLVKLEIVVGESRR